MEENIDTTPKGVAAVDRAFAIVKAVAAQSDPISLADLARVTGYYKSTLLRLLASLESASLVMRNHNGRYLLGPLAHELGKSYQTSYLMLETIKPILQRLVDQGSESSSLHVYYNNDLRICLLRIDSNHSTLDSINEGDKLPLYKGAAGKVISKFYKNNIAPSTNNVAELSIGERDADCAAVASAVFGASNEFVGAISLSGPKDRFDKDNIKKLQVMVFDAAKEATTKLGGRWPNG